MSKASPFVFFCLLSFHFVSFGLRLFLTFCPLLCLLLLLSSPVSVFSLSPFCLTSSLPVSRWISLYSLSPVSVSISFFASFFHMPFVFFLCVCLLSFLLQRVSASLSLRVSSCVFFSSCLPSASMSPSFSESPLPFLLSFSLIACPLNFSLSGSFPIFCLPVSLARTCLLFLFSSPVVFLHPHPFFSVSVCLSLFSTKVSFAYSWQ